jgi:hypothetical protein
MGHNVSASLLNTMRPANRGQQSSVPAAPSAVDLPAAEAPKKGASLGQTRQRTGRETATSKNLRALFHGNSAHALALPDGAAQPASALAAPASEAQSWLDETQGGQHADQPAVLAPQPQASAQSLVPPVLSPKSPGSRGPGITPSDAPLKRAKGRSSLLQTLRMPSTRFEAAAAPAPLAETPAPPEPAPKPQLGRAKMPGSLMLTMGAKVAAAEAPKSKFERLEQINNDYAALAPLPSAGTASEAGSDSGRRVKIDEGENTVADAAPYLPNASEALKKYAKDDLRRERPYIAHKEQLPDSPL